MSLAAVAAACTAPVAPRPSTDVDLAAARALAQDASDVLLQLSAYDYALAGTLSGEKARVVDRARYGEIARDAAARLVKAANGVLATTIDTQGKVRERLIALADGLVDVSKNALAYVDGGDPARFANVVAGVERSWNDLASVARTLKPEDDALLARVSRGVSFRVDVAAERSFVLTVGPFATAEDAAAAADAIGKIERVSREQPFVVQVGTFADQNAADAAWRAVSEKGYPGLVTPQERYTFGRSGTVPDVELWREPERVQDTQGGARRLAIAANGSFVATGADDGTIAVFTGEGKLVALPQENAGIKLIEFSEDGRFLMAGGQTLVNRIVPSGAALGTAVRFPAPAARLVYVPRAAYYVAVAVAKGADAGVIAARSPDGVPLAPFPIATPASGASLAATLVGELYVATDDPRTGGTDIEVLDLRKDPRMRGVLKAPGRQRALAIDPNGQLGAVMTDQGVFRFGPHSPDPTKTLTRIADPVSDLAFGYDGTLYLLTKTQLSAHDLRGELLWKTDLVDARRLLIAKRPVVLDAAGRVFTFDRSGTIADLGVRGTVVDLAASYDGQRVGVLLDSARALIFKLP